MNRIGIMQGRITPPVNGKIQTFPFDTWKNEFEVIQEIGLDYIEWIVTDDDNPVFDTSIGENISNISNQAEFSIRNITLDYFCEYPMTNNEYKFYLINYLLNNLSEVLINTITIPCVDFEFKYVSNIKEFIKSLVSVLTSLPTKKLFSLEFDKISCLESLFLISEFYDQSIGITYDIGNNCYYRRNIIEDLKRLKQADKLYHIHIKEKDDKGNTVPFGQGLIGLDGWKDIFKVLKNIGYQGDFTLQLARGEDGKEVETIKTYLEQIRELM